MVPQDSGSLTNQPGEPLLSNNDTEQPGEPEAGTSEYIRRRFFPDAPKDDPNLAWLQQSPKPDPSSYSLRFDLQGSPIPASTSLSLPTHLGLHHHAEGAHAGYTLEDIFLLSRSTVPAQRATMLGVLARIAHRLPGIHRGQSPGMEELIGSANKLRKRMLAAGVEALAGRGNTGVRAIELVWECVVDWGSELHDIEGVELESLQETDISNLPFDFMLPQLETILSQGATPPESEYQLLSVLHRLSQQSNVIANKVASTPKLLASILRKFLLLPIPPQDSLPLPNPHALQVFYTLILASRTNAEEVTKMADAFLRFITFLPHSSPYPSPLPLDLLIWTLRIYRALGAYGLYTEIASTAVASLVQVEQYVVSKACTSIPLKVAWSNLVETWITCACDPHQTTPAHSIKWSQIIAWRWDTGVLELQAHLGLDEADWPVWAATWRAQAAWLEGSKVNAIKCGESEIIDFLGHTAQQFKAGSSCKVVVAALDRIQQLCISYSQSDNHVAHLKAISNQASVLGSAVRLWIACLPHLDGPPSTPPFLLPFSRLSDLAACLVTHPLWSTLHAPENSVAYLYCREISDFLGLYLRLSRKLPDVTDNLFAAQACAILLRLGPGDEATAESIMKALMDLIPSYWAGTQGNQAPPFSNETDIAGILEPYMHHKLHPDPNLYIGPSTITPKSLMAATTLRLPSPASVKNMALPFHRDWTLSPLDDLLRSSDSEVFKAFPSASTVSEVETTRVCLVLTKLVQETLAGRSLHPLLLSRQEAIFRCMQIIMLEHGQPQNDSTDEVYRDITVGRLMENILEVYMVGRKPASPSSPTEDNLEQVAARFLGPSVPFFQFYTDFIELYDSVSFSHPLFANLLLPPTAMTYAQDYRKHLWSDFSHILRTVRTSPEKIISADLREYLYPVETETQIINAFLNLLLKDHLQEFPRLLAVHHLACNIWPDLAEDERVDEQKASAILKAVLQQGGNDVVRSLVRYRQRPEGTVFLPPECFEGLNEQTIQSRVDCVTRWGGPNLLGRIDALLR